MSRATRGVRPLRPLQKPPRHEVLDRLVDGVRIQPGGDPQLLHRPRHRSGYRQFLLPIRRAPTVGAQTISAPFTERTTVTGSDARPGATRSGPSQAPRL